MKKLKLDFNDFKEAEVLTRAQLKKITGGGTCGAMITNTHTGQRLVDNYGMPMSSAISYSSANSGGTFTVGGITYQYDGRYCCDQCSNYSTFSYASPGSY